MVKCPICKTPVTRENEDFPFCSERCRLIDLGKWSSEEYVVSTPLGPDEIEMLIPADGSEAPAINLEQWHPRQGSKPN